MDVSEDGITTNSESVPLLSIDASEIDYEIAKRDTQEPPFAVVLHEAQWMASSSSLIILALLLESSLLFVNVLSVGNLGTNELPAMSLSVSLVILTVLAPLHGLMTAMETFCSTAFTASHDKTLTGVYFQRGLVAIFLYSLMISPILWNMKTILLYIGLNTAIVKLCSTYMRIQILGVVPFAIFKASTRFLQAQEIMRAGTIILLIVAPIHWLTNYFLVRSPTYGIGFIGAPITTVISEWLLCAGSVIFICKSQANKSWGGWSYRAFYGMPEFFRLAVPAVVTTCSKWVGFELLTIGTSYFGATQLAGQAIILNSVWLIFQMSNGLGYSIGPHIGNLIGAGKPRQAQISGKTATAISMVIGLAGTLFMAWFGSWWASFYTKNPDVTYEAAKLTSVGCVFIISDGLNAVLGAIMRGLGHQRLNAAIYVFAFYMCGMPIGLYLGFTLEMQAIGLWWGLCIGITASSALQLLYIYQWVDWINEVKRCLLRLEQSNTNPENSTEITTSE